MKQAIEVRDHPIFWVVGWAGVIIFVITIWLDWRAGELLLVGGSSIIGFFALVILLRYGRTEIDAQRIKRITPLGCYQMEWDEVREVGVHGQIIVFEGKGKRLVIPGEVSVAAASRNEMLGYIQGRIESCSLAVKATSVWSRSKNTRIGCRLAERVIGR